MAVVAQPKVNGEWETTQVLTAHLEHMIVDAGTNVAVTGYAVTEDANTGAVLSSVKNPGEQLLETIQSVCNIVIAENASATVWHVAAEINGLSNADIEAALVEAGFAGASVTFGTYTVA